MKNEVIRKDLNEIRTSLEEVNSEVLNRLGGGGEEPVKHWIDPSLECGDGSDDYSTHACVKVALR